MMQLIHSMRSASPPMLARLAVGAALLAAVSAQAAVPAAGAQVEVHYAAGEMATERGARLVYARLKSAAREVCPGIDDRDLTRAVPARACYEAALADAVAQLRQPRLSGIHEREKRHAIG